MDGAVCGALAVAAEHAKVLLVVGRHNADSHHGGHDGNAGLFSKRNELELNAGGQYAAARANDRMARAFNQLARLFNLNGVAARVRLVADDFRFSG